MKEAIDKIFENFTEMKVIHKACINISCDEFSYENQYNMRYDDSFLLASVSKLFTTSVILNLISQGKLGLDDSIMKFFPYDEIKNLNNIRGTDYTGEITVKNLLYQNSGFPDPEGNLRMADRIKAAPLNFKELVNKTREIEGVFKPKSEKAYYSSVNFILLGEIAERIEKKKLNQIFEDIIFRPLDMNNTYLPNKIVEIPKTYFKHDKVDISKRVLAYKGAGGGVGNSEDLMVFLQAFFKGDLFDKTLIDKSEYFSLPDSFGPIEYGLGHMGIKLGNNRYIGHNGITGSFAFAKPEEKLYITGTFNQLARQTLSIDLLEQIEGLI